MSALLMPVRLRCVAHDKTLDAFHHFGADTPAGALRRLQDICRLSWDAASEEGLFAQITNVQVVKTSANGWRITVTAVFEDCAQVYEIGVGPEAS